MKSIMASKKLCILLATIILLVAISACSGGEQGTADTSNGRTNEPVEQPDVNNEVEEPTKE